MKWYVLQVMTGTERDVCTALRPFLPALQRRHELPVQLRMFRTKG